MKVFWVMTGERYIAFNPAEIAFVDGSQRAYTVYLKNGKQINFGFDPGMTVKDFIDVWDASLRGEDYKPC